MRAKYVSVSDFEKKCLWNGNNDIVCSLISRIFSYVFNLVPFECISWFWINAQWIHGKSEWMYLLCAQSMFPFPILKKNVCEMVIMISYAHSFRDKHKKPLLLWSSVSTNDKPSFLEFSSFQFKVPISAETKNPSHLNFYVPYARHYNPRFVFFLPHFSLRFIFESGL
jgi:hypothetical protein